MVSSLEEGKESLFFCLEISFDSKACCLPLRPFGGGRDVVSSLFGFFSFQ